MQIEKLLLYFRCFQEYKCDRNKKAFRDKAKEYHPDVCKRIDAHQRFIEVGEAYEILKNSSLREEYDLHFNHSRGGEQRTYAYSCTA